MILIGQISYHRRQKGGYPQRLEYCTFLNRYDKWLNVHLLDDLLSAMSPIVQMSTVFH